MRVIKNINKHQHTLGQDTQLCVIHRGQLLTSILPEGTNTHTHTHTHVHSGLPSACVPPLLDTQLFPIHRGQILPEGTSTHTHVDSCILSFSVPPLGVVSVSFSTRPKQTRPFEWNGESSSGVIRAVSGSGERGRSDAGRLGQWRRD